MNTEAMDLQLLVLEQRLLDAIRNHDVPLLQSLRAIDDRTGELAGTAIASVSIGSDGGGFILFAALTVEEKDDSMATPKVMIMSYASALDLASNLFKVLLESGGLPSRPA